MEIITRSKKVFHKFVSPIEGIIKKATKRYKSDKGYRKFFTGIHVLTLIYYQISNLVGLNDLEEALKTNERVQDIIGTEGVDISNLSRANSSRTFKVFRNIFHSLFPKAMGLCGVSSKVLEVLTKTKIIDGSFLDCCASIAWARYKKTKNKIKLHLILNLKLLPEKLVVTCGTGSERDILRQNIKRTVTYIFDRGYNCYELFFEDSS